MRLACSLLFLYSSKQKQIKIQITLKISSKPFMPAGHLPAKVVRVARSSAGTAKTLQRQGDKCWHSAYIVNINLF
jgi:hypothetical protein